MKRSDAFPSRFLSSDEVGDKQYRLIIGQVVMEEMLDDNGVAKDVPVCHFQNTQKVLRLNATNWDTLADTYGDDSEEWFGKQVFVYVDPRVKFGKKFVKGLRLRIEAAPKAAKPAPALVAPLEAHSEINPPAFEDEIPF